MHVLWKPPGDTIKPMNAPSRRSFVKWISTAPLLAALPTIAAQPRKKPNFVFILMDDLGQRDISCYGSTFYETPNIDRLAAEGMRFTDAYASCPVCSPTRASILSGKYPARLKLTEWIGGNRHGKLRSADYIKQLPLEELTLAEALREAGYATGFVGKWHLGKEDYYPDRNGFDINIAGNDHGSPPSYFWPYENAKGDYKLDLAGGKEGEYLTDRLTDEAIKWMESRKERPFLLYLSHYAVHNPQQAKPELVEKYKKKLESTPPAQQRFARDLGRDVRQVQDSPVYAAMVQSMDESVGRIMDKLRQLELHESTVVIFTSDNGGLSTAEGTPTSNAPLRAGKGWCYEGGIREPLIIKWPGVTKPGSTCDVPVTSTDFYPTMLEMAGLPLRPRQHLDGISLAPVLRGVGKLDRQAIYWHYPHYSNQGGPPSAAVRSGDWKLIEFFEDGHVELYNLREDIAEKNDLANRHPQKAKELTDMLHRWLKDVDAAMPTPNPSWKPAAG